MNTNSVFLKGGDFYITENAENAFRVIKGTVLVFIVPYNNGTAGRRSFVYEANEEETIPAFSYRDIEYCNWRFCLVALDKAELAEMQNASTKVLQRKFCEKAKIANFRVEGYNNGLVDQYRKNIVAEDSFIKRTKNNRETTAASVLRLIYRAFDSDKTFEAAGTTNSELYNSMALLCNKNSIKIAPYEKIIEACSEDFGISDIARISNFTCREILLEVGWHKTDSGSFLVFDENKKPFVCLPNGTSSYILYDPETASGTPVTEKVAARLNARAYMVYRPLPAVGLKTKDIIAFCSKSIKTADVIWLLAMTAITAFIGLLTPRVSQIIYDRYIPLGTTTVIFQIGCALAAFMLANILFAIAKNLISFRIASRISYDFQSAMYSRLFNLPESFFRKYESADLAQRAMGAGPLINSVASAFITSSAALIIALIYFINMLSYSVLLSFAGLAMIIVYCVIYYFIAVSTLRKKRKSIEIEGKAGSAIFQLLSGISKIRIAGVEDRALYEYLKPYVKYRNTEEKIFRTKGFGTTLALIINTIFSVVLYILVVNTGGKISFGTFVAFITVFGAFCVCFTQLMNGLIRVKREKPDYDRIKPILEAVPEIDDAKELPGDISGAIEINNVTFAYDADSPNVLDGINLNIKAGEYVGIVGSSGCGKSTLLKLLLGFEKPKSGKIYYDNKDIENLDKRELRKKMGVVLQDGKLISGSIFENITITSPKSTINDVNEAIKAVGLDKDIEEMPMGLYTVLSEDCGTISGGQQQRILIARAIISKPHILFFDEATSALDNVTQKMVTSTIEKMDSTRVVIAHRLSTIINCDRIIVMDNGRIVEQGSYNELMNNKGLFFTLASRQIP